MPSKARTHNAPMHRHYQQVSRVQAMRKADANRPSAAKRGYDAKWSAYRKWFLARHPLCVMCDTPKSATHVDHIRAVRGPDDPGFWDESNHQALCHSCHSRKTCREDGGLGHAR